MSSRPPNVPPTASAGPGPALEALDALPAGTRLHEFEIRGVLGVGGFGIVYRAWDEALEREVAIKEYLPSALAGRGEDAQVSLRSAAHADTYATGLRSFVNEARLLARFDHPALVKVYRFWEDNRTAYMVMPCYHGLTLQDTRRAMDRPPDEAWLRALVDPLLGALEVLHAQSCYHRDIAPDNILLQLDPAQPQGPGRPVLLDFGAARRVIADRTHDLTAILKPAFAPIEQYAEVSHLHQGPWTDLYALAAVLYYCLSGKAPPPATARVVRDELKPAAEVGRVLAEAWPGLRYSPVLLQTIDAALSVRPEERPQSVAQWRVLWDAAAFDLDLRPAPAASVPVAVPAADPSDGWASTIAQEPANAPASRAATRAWRRRALGAGAVLIMLGLALAFGLSEPRAPVRDTPVAAQQPAGAPGPDASAAPAAALAPTPADPAAPAAREPERLPPRAVELPAQSRRTEARDAAPARGAVPETALPDRTPPPGPSSPREACGRRVLLALWRCLEEQCASPRFAQHPQCREVREWRERQRSEGGL